MTEFEGAPSDAKVCAVCSRVLSYWEPFGWIHAIQQLREPDHRVSPVRVVVVASSASDLSHADDSTTVCGTCLEPLDLVHPYGWTHDVSRLQDKDHPPVPVDPDQVHVTGRCDFCQADHPDYEIPCRPFELDALPHNASSPDWAACATCARLVDTNQWGKLRKRAVRSIARSTGHRMSPEAELVLRRIYAQIRANVTGKSRPLSRWPGPTAGGPRPNPGEAQ